MQKQIKPQNIRSCEKQIKPQNIRSCAITCLFVEKKSKNCSTAAATPRLRHWSGHSKDMASRACKHCQSEGGTG